ncbi:MAG: hypothetical protein QOG43_1730 [Actinomycetota bacterium]|jgi:hypothetical protein|nr:hypothetical protein [Actinomycetota bacterium]
MSVANRAVSALLRSPLHRLLSGSTDVIRYRGRRSGRTISTPTQYARVGQDVVILVGKPETKTWWRNFRAPSDVEVLLQGRWTNMTAQSVVGIDERERTAPLLDAYLSRFPKASRALGGGTRDDMLTRAVMVRCQPILD